MEIMSEENYNKYISEREILIEMSKILKCNVGDIPVTIQKLKKDIDDINQEIVRLKNESIKFG